MNALPAVAAAVAALMPLLLRQTRRRATGRRLRRVRSLPPTPVWSRRSARPRPPRQSPNGGEGLRLTARAWWLPVAVGLGTAAVIGSGSGLVAGSLAAAAGYRWLPRPASPAVRHRAREQEQLLRQLPLTAELLAACLGSSSSPGRAATAVASSLGSPMRERLETVAVHLSLGALPEACWGQLGAEEPVLAPLSRCLVRTAVSGTPPAAALVVLAQEQRATATRAAHSRVRRAGVLATAPLGLCFLPAFVLVGVVPVVMGLTVAYTQRI